MTSITNLLNRSLLLVAIMFCIAAPQTVRAQQNLNEFQQRALTALQTGQWEESLKLTTGAIDTFGARGKTLWGDSFGWFYYMQGFSYVKLKQYEPAMESFQKCYEDFPNIPPKDKNDPRAAKKNVNRNKALLRWAETAILAKDYETAAVKYDAVLKIPKAEIKYNTGKVNLDLAICHLNKNEPDPKRGIKALQLALKNKILWRTPDSRIMQGFQALIQYAIRTGKEGVLVDFIAENRADVELSPYIRQRFAPIFMKEAGTAFSANLNRAAFLLYSLVPSTESAIADLEARLAAFAPRNQVIDGGNVLQRKVMQQQLKDLKTRKAAHKSYETTALQVIGLIHERMGNLRSAYAAYEQLETFYSKNKNRENNLYNLVRMASATSQAFKTEEYGQKFIKAFPNSASIPTVERLMLSALFYNGEYKKCINVAKVMIKKVESGTDRHDVILHILGGSYYYEGRVYDAEPYLREHTKTYKESKSRMAALFFEGSNASRIQDYDRAGRLLDSFLKTYPDPTVNAFIPFALFDRASVHYAQSENEEALVSLNRIETEFPSTGVMDISLNLKGNVFETDEKAKEAEEYYLKALALSERLENHLVAGDSLSYLVGLLGANEERTEDSLTYYDKFWAQYAEGSSLRPQVAVSGLKAMIKHERGEEGLEKMRTVISDMARNANANTMERIINSYTDAFLDNGNTVEDLKKHYYEFPKIDNEDKATLALLRIALIGVYEDELKAAGNDQAKARKAEASIKVLFADLRNSFPPDVLSNFILVRLGDYLRTQTGQPNEAVPYYRAAISNEDSSFNNEAQFGLADVLGKSIAPSNRAEAIGILDKIFAQKDLEKSLREKALYRIVEIHSTAKEWASVEKRGLEYLNSTPRFSTFAPQVGLMYANALYEMGNMRNALVAYTKVFGANIGNVSIAAPALTRLADIGWQRNNDDDRQKAYNTLAGWVKNMERNIPKFQPNDKKRYEGVAKIRQSYEESGQIKTLAEQEAEKERNK